jgi:hypothetical protein
VNVRPGVDRLDERRMQTEVLAEQHRSQMKREASGGPGKSGRAHMSVSCSASNRSCPTRNIPNRYGLGVET